MVDDPNSLGSELAHTLLQIYRGGVPEHVRARTRLHIADAMGIALAARGTELAGQVVRAQALGAGGGRHGLIGGGQATALGAAFVNASLIHIQDYDDIHDAGRLHPSACVVPAVLAAAQLREVNDEVIVDAVAIGNELMCRLGMACAPQGEGPGSEWFLTQLFGYLGAAMGAGLVLGLNHSALVSSLGLAYMQLAGGKEAAFSTGATARGIYPAFAAQGGLQAALLAQAGIVGPSGALDGEASMFRLYLAGALSSRQRHVLMDFSVWHAMQVDIKPWPSCRLSHPYVAVALAARDAYAAHPEVTIRVAVNASAGRLCRPLAQRRRPRTLQDAKYSIPFMTAYALTRGEPTLSGLVAEVLKDGRVLSVADRIELEDGLPDNPGHPRAVITLVSGARVVHRAQFDPVCLTLDETRIRTKFVDCLGYAGREADAESLWQRLLQGQIQAAFLSICAS